MNGVLYALTAEVFPTQARGTGNAIAATCNRIFGIMVRWSPGSFLVKAKWRCKGPLLTIHADLDFAPPIWVAGVLYLVSGMSSHSGCLGR